MVDKFCLDLNAIMLAPFPMVVANSWAQLTNSCKFLNPSSKKWWFLLPEKQTGVGVPSVSLLCKVISHSFTFMINLHFISNFSEPPFQKHPLLIFNQKVSWHLQPSWTPTIQGCHYYFRKNSLILLDILTTHTYLSFHWTDMGYQKALNLFLAIQIFGFITKWNCASKWLHRTEWYKQKVTFGNNHTQLDALLSMEKVTALKWNN